MFRGKCNDWFIGQQGRANWIRSCCSANEGFNVLKTQYGSSNCFLLRINSHTPGLEKVEHLPDPWSQFLNSRIDLKNYQLSPTGSPEPKRHDSFEIGQEANETRNTSYHPLSPELENILVMNFRNNIFCIITHPLLDF